MIIKRIEKLTDALVIITDKPVLNSERASILAELKRISAETIGLTFFRVEA